MMNLELIVTFEKSKTIIIIILNIHIDKTYIFSVYLCWIDVKGLIIIC